MYLHPEIELIQNCEGENSRGFEGSSRSCCMNPAVKWDQIFYPFAWRPAPALVSRGWCGITDLIIYDQKKSAWKWKNIQTRKRVKGGGNICCRMLLLPRGLTLCSDIYRRGCYWILPGTEQEYTSAQWLLWTECNSTEWAGGAGDPLFQNGEISFLHL